MTKINYYQTTNEKLYKSFCALAEKCYSNNFRTIVITPNIAEIENLDKILWTYSRQHFIPHATTKDPFPEKQAIYFTTTVENPNNSTIIIFVNPDRDLILSTFSYNESFNIKDFVKILFLVDEQVILSFTEVSDIIKKSILKEYEVEYFNQKQNGNWQKVM